jgi:hypothetical protein
VFFNKEQVSQKEIIRWGIGGAVAEIVYVLLIVGLFSVLEKILATPPQFIGFLFMLLLFVFSAGISGLFVFGMPLYLALQKKYTEAISMIFVTFATLFASLILILLINLIF